MKTIVSYINSVITFLIEMIMLVSCVLYGLSKQENIWIQLSYAAALLTVVIFLWAIVAAPTSKRRLKMPYLVFFRTGMFLMASFLLYQSGHTNAAMILAGVSVVNQTISYFTER